MSNNFKKERTANSPIYLKDNSYLKPKEMFKFIERLSFKKKKKTHDKWFGFNSKPMFT